MTAQPDELPDAKAAALEALTKASTRRPLEKRLTATTLRGVVDVAWKYQFDPQDRAAARRELKELLAPEVQRARAGS